MPSLFFTDRTSKGPARRKLEQKYKAMGLSANKIRKLVYRKIS